MTLEVKVEAVKVKLRTLFTTLFEVTTQRSGKV